MSVTQLFFLSSRSCWEVYIFFGFRAIKACCPVVSRFILVRLAARVVWPTVITALFRATICYCFGCIQCISFINIYSIFVDRIMYGCILCHVDYCFIYLYYTAMQMYQGLVGQLYGNRVTRVNSSLKNSWLDRDWSLNGHEPIALVEMRSFFFTIYG